MHIGNAVVKEGFEAYGDQHPRFGFPDSANDTEQLVDFFSPESERWSKREAMQQVQIQIVVLLPWYSPYPYKNVAQC